MLDRSSVSTFDIYRPSQSYNREIKGFLTTESPSLLKREEEQSRLILTDIQINAKNKLRVWDRDPQIRL